MELTERDLTFLAEGLTLLIEQKQRKFNGGSLAPNAYSSGDEVILDIHDIACLRDVIRTMATRERMNG